MRVALAITVLALALPIGVASATARAGNANPTQAQIARAIRGARRSKALWATVNICNSRSEPHTLGIRGQMPSLGFPSWLSMRIQVTYYSSAHKRFVTDPSSLKLIHLGRSSYGLQQGGAVYAFRPHAGLLSAAIQFVWERSGRLLGTATAAATAGHRSADFGSPPHFSAAQCKLR